MKNLKTSILLGLFAISSTTFQITTDDKIDNLKKISALDNKLWYAVADSKYESAKKLISKGANPNTVFPYMGPLLITAINMDDKKMLLLLLKAGANPNIESFLFDNTPLYYAIYYKNNPEMVKILLDAGANPNTQSQYSGKTLLHYAVEQNNPEIVKMLLHAGANPNIKTFFYDNSPLNLARDQENINPEIINLLEKSLS